MCLKCFYFDQLINNPRTHIYKKTWKCDVCWVFKLDEWCGVILEDKCSRKAAFSPCHVLCDNLISSLQQIRSFLLYPALQIISVHSVRHGTGECLIIWHLRQMSRHGWGRVRVAQPNPYSQWKALDISKAYIKSYHSHQRERNWARKLGNKAPALTSIKFLGSLACLVREVTQTRRS